MNVFLAFVQLVHGLVWIFIGTAFFNKRLAYINLYYLIPLTYLSYLVFHGCVLKVAEEASATGATPDEKRKNIDTTIHKMNPLKESWNKTIDHLKQSCCYNPLSPQGILLFGVITSAYRLKPSDRYFMRK